MNQKIGEIIWNLMVFGGFVYALLIMRGIVKTSVEVKTLQQPTPFIKILVYGGVIIFGLLVVMDILGK